MVLGSFWGGDPTFLAFMDNKIKISFDFDDTLTRKNVQDLVRKLPKSETSLYIVTSRLGNIQRMKHGDLKSNEDIFELASELGIPPHKISFTNQTSKWMVLNESGVKIHIDDDLREVHSLNWYGIVKCFHALSPTLEEEVFDYIQAIREF